MFAAHAYQHIVQLYICAPKIGNNHQRQHAATKAETEGIQAEQLQTRERM
jgi:hypothetical protein